MSHTEQCLRKPTAARFPQILTHASYAGFFCDWLSNLNRRGQFIPNRHCAASFSGSNLTLNCIAGNERKRSPTAVERQEEFFREELAFQIDSAHAHCCVQEGTKLTPSDHGFLGDKCRSFRYHWTCLDLPVNFPKKKLNFFGGKFKFCCTLQNYLY